MFCVNRGNTRFVTMGQYLSVENHPDHPENESDEEYFEPEGHIVEGNVNDSEETMNTVNYIQRQMNSTDAVQSIFRAPTTSNITPEQVESFEKDLDFSEKVSLVFLLYENADVALEVLLREKSYHNSKVQSSSKLISDWARSKHATSWQNQLLEALCIINNFSITRKLGYDKDDLNLRYLPSNPNVSLFINKTRKVLLKVCEMLFKHKTKQFLCLLREDFENSSIDYQHFDEKYLEMYFLNCFSRHYIENDNLANIIKIFKQMELESLCDMLRSAINTPADEIKNDKTSKKYVKKCEEVFQESSPNCSDSEEIKVKFDLNGRAKDQNYVQRDQNFARNDTSVISSRSMFKDDELYYVDPNNPGICLIINQRNFYTEPDPKLRLSLPLENLKDRHGTDVDRNKLKETFNKLGFKVIVVENLTHSQLQSEIRRIMKMFSKKDSCLVVCVMSHGCENNVYGVNSIPVEIKDIEDILHDVTYTNVLQKPKILIMQSCQGEPLQDVILYNEEHNTVDSPKKIEIRGKRVHRESHIVTDGPSMTPARSDLLVCSSTIPGYASIRNENEGSWYIQELCKVIMEERHRRHFVDILTSVNNNVSQRSWYIENKRKTVCMVPDLRSSFRKWLFLPTAESSFP